MKGGQIFSAVCLFFASNAEYKAAFLSILCTLEVPLPLHGIHTLDVLRRPGRFLFQRRRVLFIGVELEDVPPAGANPLGRDSNKPEDKLPEPAGGLQPGAFSEYRPII